MRRQARSILCPYNALPRHHFNALQWAHGQAEKDSIEGWTKVISHWFQERFHLPVLCACSKCSKVLHPAQNMLHRRKSGSLIRMKLH